MVVGRGVTLLLLVRQRTNKNNKSALFDNEAANLHECVHSSIPSPFPSLTLSLSPSLSIYREAMEMSTSTSTAIAIAASSHANRRKVSTTCDKALNQFRFYCLRALAHSLVPLSRYPRYATGPVTSYNNRQ